mgnify:CR=1 FL=1
MRVKIQYSIDMDELPTLTASLIEKAVDHIDVELLQELQAPYDLLSLETAECIDKLRQSLATTDALLEDAHNIILGYLQYKTTPVPNQPLPAPVDPTELQQKLDMFKEALSQESDDEVPS